MLTGTVVLSKEGFRYSCSLPIHGVTPLGWTSQLTLVGWKSRCLPPKQQTGFVFQRAFRKKESLFENSSFFEAYHVPKRMAEEDGRKSKKVPKMTKILQE